MRTFNQFENTRSHMEFNDEQLARGINPRASPPQRRGPEKLVPERSRQQSVAGREGLATSTTRYFACTGDSLQNDRNVLFVVYPDLKQRWPLFRSHPVVYFNGFEKDSSPATLLHELPGID